MKNVTLSIAKELKALLDKDPHFRGVLTRKSDYYISVPERSEIARKFKANYLISIHADSSESPDRRGLLFGYCQTVEPMMKWVNG